MIRQLSEVHGWTPEQLADAFDEIHAELYDGEWPWREVGVSAQMVLRFCAQQEISCYVFWGHRLVHKQLGSSHQKAVCFAVWGNHLWCYSEAGFAKNMAVHSLGQISERLRGDVQTKNRSRRWHPGEACFPGSTGTPT